MTGSRVRCNHIVIGQIGNTARIEKGIIYFSLKFLYNILCMNCDASKWRKMRTGSLRELNKQNCEK